MNFSVPKEYADFVTGAGDLLDQFNSGSSALETVSYSVYSLGGDVLKAIEILTRATALLEPLTRNYLWHNEMFRLVIKADPGEPVSLFGTTCIGECIEDEWFIVYLLLKLSKEIPDIVISVVDSDGQFLLIEAADHIEDWVGPDNADNRVWIRNGTFHIIPLDEPGRSATGGMKLDKAVKCLLNENSGTRNFDANEGFHRTIYQRTLQAFPARALANRHCALCIVPGWLASLIQDNPHVVARAVVEFHKVDKDQLRQACAASSAGKSTGTSPADQRLVLIPVQFTRALYAQLTFKNFHPPRKYHAMMRRVAAASSRKVSQAFDLGCRLACGVDCAYSNSSDAAKYIDNSCSALENNPAWLELLNFVSAAGPVNESLLCQLQSLFTSDQISSTANFERYRAGDSVFPGGFRRLVDMAARRPLGADVVLEADQEAADRAVFRRLVEGAESGDAEDWLYMTPEELDREMQTRVDRFAAASGASETTSAPVRVAVASVATGDSVHEAPVPQKNEAMEGQASAAALQNMVDGFKTFMEGSSDIDGITFAPTLNVKKERPVKTKDISKPISNSIGGLQIDYDYLESLLQGDSIASVTTHLNVESQTEKDGAEGQTQEAVERERADLAGYFSKEDLRPLDGDGGEASEDSDSDDEDDRQGAQAADQYLESILKGAASSPAAVRSSTPATSSPIKIPTEEVLQGVGGGYLQPSPSRRRGFSTEVDSDDEVEEVPRSSYRDHEVDFNDGHGEEDDDEDDDYEGEDQDELDEGLIREYQKLMDSELFQDSSLAQTFEWTNEGRAGGTNDDVDLDMNLLKNLMEAQSQGMGSPLAGPLGQLMAQLGINMPMPPPMKQKP